ncbi:transcription factor bHLH121 isoform X2 [Typha angustifolia]|uniref:transcription factor bHLH121 isoform X2 n=1 Tax=Typha angustifolia TaxID=59011 RepID=UPI003C2B9437
MDQWKPPEGFFQTHQSSADISNLSQSSCPNSRVECQPRNSIECQPRNSIAARKIQKADREKMRRDRLNEQFVELGKALDPERPKNDKATILADTVQMLKDLTSQVNRLKAEYATLSGESHELTQEKNELREEKASIKSEIDSLNVQYQQRLRVLYPWAAVEPSVLMAPPPAYPFPVPVPIPSGPVPIHLRPYPFFQNQRSGSIPNQCSTYMPYSQPCNLDQPSTQHNPLLCPSSNMSHPASVQDSRSNTSTHQLPTLGERCEDYGDVATELELKTPGSMVSSHSKVVHDKDSSSTRKKEKQWSQQKKESSFTDPSSSCGCSSSGGLESSSTSVGNGSVAENLN